MKLPLECIDAKELAWRHERVRQVLRKHCPEAGGLLSASRVSIYYLTGTLGTGLIWLPLEGEPVLLVRKGFDRAKAESSLQDVVAFRSYKDIMPLCTELKSPLTATIGVEMDSFTWNSAQLLTQRLPNTTFIAADQVLMRAMAVKSPWELVKMRIGGERHRLAISDQLPECIQAGMTERAIGMKAWDLFCALGHCGIMRVRATSEEMYFGFVCAGESSIYPNAWDGPLGCLGQHPSVPSFGNDKVVWQKQSLLVLDVGFTYEGYHTDKTKVYWSGASSSVPEIVYKAQQTCMDIYNTAIESLRAGALPSTLWEAAKTQAIQAGYADMFQGVQGNNAQFLGHGIGLFLDMYPAFARGFDAPLEVGMTVAIEPKIAVPGYGMVGVENTFEITPTGAESLTGHDIDMAFVE